ncbi:MAG: DHH family phosphoesterase, partial [Planctomycetota bacterium]
SGELEEFLIDAASLVALGTVADVVPLRGENRVLVRRGLDALRASRSPGILALLDILGPGSSSLTADDIAFRLGPRLNAAGRMAHASLAVELLTAPSYGVAQEKARELELWNKRRQSVEQSVFAELLEAIGDVSSAPVILACREGWHLGILGILAARLAERFRRPSLVLRIEEGLARGSGRSIRGIDLRSLLDRIELAGLRSGGHAAAVGLELPADRLPSFRERLELAARDMPAPRSEPWRIDASVGLGHWCSSELRRLADFGPFGAGNPPPSFLARNVRIGAALRRVGRDGTGLAFNAIQDGVSVQALAPQLGARMETLLRQREPWDLVYAPRFASRAELGPLEILVHEMRAGTTDGRSDERAHGS